MKFDKDMIGVKRSYNQMDMMMSEATILAKMFETTTTTKTIMLEIMMKLKHP